MQEEAGYPSLPHSQTTSYPDFPEVSQSLPHHQVTTTTFEARSSIQVSGRESTGGAGFQAQMESLVCKHLKSLA